jgi:hypothetical protein
VDADDNSETGQHITPITAEERGMLALHVLRVDELAEAELDGRTLQNDETDLDLLQALLDGGTISQDDTHDLHCLGVVFGARVAAAVADVAWVMVEDAYGRDPALRYADTSLLAFPKAMIAKRVEDGEDVNVRELFVGLCCKLEELKAEVIRPH